MSRSRVAFIVPAELGEVSATVSRYGGAGPDIAGNAFPSLVASSLGGCVGEATQVTFENAYARSAADALCRDLGREGVGYLALLDGGVDPSMCMPVPARLLVGGEILDADRRDVSLPLGFPEPGFDARTLLASGMTPAEAAACLAAVTRAGGASLPPSGTREGLPAAA